MIDKWVRAFVGETAVVDTREPLLFWQEPIPVPGYAFAKQDVRTDLLRPASEKPRDREFFHLPRGPVAQAFDLVLEGRVLPYAAWTLDDPGLQDHVIFTWDPTVIDRWLEEDELVIGHPRDPYTRVEAIASTRHITVHLNGALLADTRSPVLLFETDLPTRYYIPRHDVNPDALEPSENESVCPYKGVAAEYWTAIAPPEVQNVGWSYAEPFPAVANMKGMIAFYNELTDVTIDGEPQERPVSLFSRSGNRPGS